MKVSEITEILDKWMPISIAEDFDNVGLLVGDLNSEVKNILVTLDTTLNVVDEALDKDCNLIVSYHPIIFNGLKKITTDSGYVQKSVIKAVKNNISVYAIHTSLDNHPEGISYFLSKSITLSKIKSEDRNVSLIPIPDKTPIDDKHPALIPSKISFCVSPTLTTCFALTISFRSISL